MLYLMLANGFEETEAIAALDVIRRGGLKIKTVGVNGLNVTGAHGVKLEADILPEEIYPDNAAKPPCCSAAELTVRLQAG